MEDYEIARPLAISIYRCRTAEARSVLLSAIPTYPVYEESVAGQSDTAYGGGGHGLTGTCKVHTWRWKKNRPAAPSQCQHRRNSQNYCGSCWGQTKHKTGTKDSRILEEPRHDRDTPTFDIGLIDVPIAYGLGRRNSNIECNSDVLHGNSVRAVIVFPLLLQ